MPNVLAPVKIKVEAEVPPPIVTLPHVSPPPAKVRVVPEVADERIVEDAALKVNPVVVEKSTMVPVPTRVTVLEPSVTALVFELLLVKVLQEILKPPLLNVPLVTVKGFVPVPRSSASASVRVPVPSIVIGQLRIFPFEVSVLEPSGARVKTLVLVAGVWPVPIVRLPYILFPPPAAGLVVPV